MLAKALRLRSLLLLKRKVIHSLLLCLYFCFANKFICINTDVENRCKDTKEGRDGGMNWEFGIDIYTLLCIKWITNGNLLYSTGNAHCCLGTSVGRRPGVLPSTGWQRVGQDRVTEQK